ncbi:MAG: hypothetical protein HUU20_28830, partial [Pirellulales bacterium]|nr:hypothetical protein [Pirellulales bacterium]
TFLPWLAVCVLALPWFARAWADRARLVAAYGLAAAAVLAPWVMRNQVHFGQPIAGTTHGGYTLLLANNPWFYHHLDQGPWRAVWPADELNQWWVSRTSRGTPDDELRADRLAYEEARANIRRQPGMFLYACVVRVGWLWSPLAHQVNPHEPQAERLARYAVGLWNLAELALAVVGLAAVFLARRAAKGELRVERGTWVWGVLLVLVFTAVHAVYWTNIRMRAPLMPVVVLAAAAGCGAVRRRKR